MPSASSKLWKLNQNYPLKYLTPAQILIQFKIMITSLIKMLEFGQMTISTIWFDSTERDLLVALCVEIMVSWPLIQNTFLKKKKSLQSPVLPTSSKVQLLLIKQPLKALKKLKVLGFMD